MKKQRKRMARNPRTGEQVRVEDHYVPLFKVSKELKGLVNESLSKSNPEGFGAGSAPQP